MMRSLSASRGSMLVPCTRKAWATKVIRKKQKRTATDRSCASSHSARQIWERVSSRGGVIVSIIDHERAFYGDPLIEGGFTAGNRVITLTLVPEPASAASLALGLSPAALQVRQDALEGLVDLVLARVVVVDEPDLLVAGAVKNHLARLLGHAAQVDGTDDMAIVRVDDGGVLRWMTEDVDAIVEWIEEYTVRLRGSDIDTTMLVMIGAWIAAHLAWIAKHFGVTIPDDAVGDDLERIAPGARLETQRADVIGAAGRPAVTMGFFFGSVPA